MTTFRNIQTKADVAPYLARLNDGYEERSKIVAHIIKQIEQLGLDAPVVAELCVGPGFIATSLCEAFPSIHYVGLDFMQPFLDFTAEQLPVEANYAFVLADLTEDAWPTLLAEQATAGGFKAGPFSAESYDAAALILLAMQAAGSSESGKLKEKVFDVANAPGEKIFPGELAKALKIIADGGDVDYVGASAVELVGAGESAGNYRQIEIKDGAVSTVGYR